MEVKSVHREVELDVNQEVSFASEAKEVSVRR
jgi:hypothetical protein